MSVRVLNVGVGVFTLTLLWSLAILLYVFTRNARKPVSTVGKGAIALLLLITTITVFVPKYSPLSDSADAENDSDPLTKVNSALEPDWKYIGRAILLVLDVVFLIATVGLLFSNYLLRKIVR